MFDWLYFWNLIWSFFTLLSLVFVPVFIVMIYFVTRTPRARAPGARPGASSRFARSDGAVPGPVGESHTKKAA
ncbi:hypothetical protein LTH96_11980 [Nesterenkonia sp. LB17]|uniref:hypothetical protein n=1 Tax=unclassified Nesterenkonia TaxID=2629769 RepID=UPI001F4C6573|nr:MULTISPECIES: hypothetical protein [unclassified Nesterenkonia]MCH8561394.1 hypothetical protein [Nesterenkonia sp. DZ6]MCH8566433.1 hypothetical protein [Nesterenkonia sp. LB17]MCH8572000.1 hypothetical protein [Nesterenkonia sp. AY15]